MAGTTIETSEKDDAAVVSPLIVMHGGNVHFSGAKIELLENGFYKRTQTTETPMGVALKDAQPEKMEIDTLRSGLTMAARALTFV
jgi:hypothetical protein